MKNLNLLAALAAAAVWGTVALLGAYAQTPPAAHSVTLTWTASPDSTPANPGTVAIYKASGNCPASGIGTLTYAVLASSVAAAGSYTDTSVLGGHAYCYYFVATIAGNVSGPTSITRIAVPIDGPKVSGAVN